MEEIEERVVNLHEAKTNLSQLVKDALSGEQVIIARAGERLVKLVPVDQPEPAQRRRLGFLVDHAEFRVPDAETFNALGRDEIEHQFGGGA